MEEPILERLGSKKNNNREKTNDYIERKYLYTKKDMKFMYQQIECFLEKSTNIAKSQEYERLRFVNTQGIEKRNVSLHSDGRRNKSQNSTTYAFFMIRIDDMMIVNFDVFR